MYQKYQIMKKMKINYKIKILKEIKNKKYLF